ncbi:hypothetical protein BGP_3787 [Beggiatoa sp. PS]|nr:hypothetical protein BGP_3787 [Beggiatoa sp. PS]
MPELVEGNIYGCLRHGSTSSPTAQATILGIFVFENRLSHSLSKAKALDSKILA